MTLIRSDKKAHTDMARMTFENVTENLLNDLPIVEICVGLNSLSVNLRSMQVFPTPESPSMSSLTKTSYCFAMIKTKILTGAWLYHVAVLGDVLERTGALGCLQGPSETSVSERKLVEQLKR